MVQTVTCPHCRKALAIPDDAPASGLACPRCLAPLPDREGTAIQTDPGARLAVSSSRLAAEEFVNQGRRDIFLGAAAIGSVVLLCVFGYVLLTKASVNKGWAEGALPLFGLFDLVVVSLLTVWFTRGLRGKSGGTSAEPLRGCAVPLLFLAVLFAGFVFFFVVCFNVALSGPLH